MPRSAEYGRARRDPRQGWWVPAESAAPMAPAFTQHHRLSSRRCAHRRTVEGSGKRDGSLQCGAACSAESPAAMRSQACCRQRKLKGAAGASQSGKIVKVFPHGWQIPRRTQMRSCRSSWAWRERRPWPMIVWFRQTGHRRGSRSKRDHPGSMLSFVLWQCDKENHGWREGPPLTVSAKVSICWPGLHPPGKVSFERKKNTALRWAAASPSLRTLAGLNPLHVPQSSRRAPPNTVSPLRITSGWRVICPQRSGPDQHG